VSELPLSEKIASLDRMMDGLLSQLRAPAGMVPEVPEEARLRSKGPPARLCPQCEKDFPLRMFVFPVCPLCALKNHNEARANNDPVYGEIALRLWRDAKRFDDKRDRPQAPRPKRGRPPK
jgi:hypothetical protein